MFLVGNAYPAVVRIDVETEKIVYIDKFTEEVSNNGNIGWLNAKQFILENDYLYLGFKVKNAVLVINTLTLDCNVMAVDVPLSGVSGLSLYDKDRWLISGARGESCNIYLWNHYNNIIENEFVYGESVSDNCLYFMKKDIREIYVLSFGSWNGKEEDIAILNIKENKLEKTDVMKRIVCNTDNYVVSWNKILYAGWKDKNVIEFVTGADLQGHDFDTETGTVDNYSPQICADQQYDTAEYEYYRESKKRVFLEEKDESLNLFIRRIIES